jgi:hypothetical protein
MAAFFARVISLIGVDLLKSLVGWAVSKFNQWRAARAARKADEAKNKQVREQTEAAESRKEREDALKNELRNS